MIPWVVITNSVTESGGQERANFELVRYLAKDRARYVHVVSHALDRSLGDNANVIFHRVPRPSGSDFAGQFVLRYHAATVVKTLKRDGRVHVLANGGNFASEDANWVHTVHSAWRPKSVGAPAWVRLKNRLVAAVNREDERRAFAHCRLLLANSILCKKELEKAYPWAAGRVKVVYLGVDRRYGKVCAEERATARKNFAVASDELVIVFVGSMGLDGRKGLDTTLSILTRLVGAIGRRVTLLVAGRGASSYWSTRIRKLRLTGSVRLIGELSSTAELLAAADLALSPTRFDAYGLGVHEALCREIPTFVSSKAGVAERIPMELDFLVLRQFEDASACAEAIIRSFPLLGPAAMALATFSERLRGRTWSDMAEEIRLAVEGQRQNRGPSA